MKSLIFCMLALFSSLAFASGEFFIAPVQSLDQNKTYGSFGLNVDEKIVGAFHYKSWTAFGDDVLYNADKRLEWFQTHQGISVAATKKFSIEGGYAYHYIWGFKDVMAFPNGGRDNGVYVRLGYKAW